MPQIKPSVTNPTIAEVYQNIESNKLILKPDFQRRFVWTHDHQEEFIDTILKGFPFPEIYVCQGEIDIKKLKTTQHVIDGQQRLTTIKNYIDNNFRKPLHKVVSYNSLTDVQRKEFLQYQIVFRDIGEVDDDVIREVFRRINLTKFKLDDIELHNAIYDGEYITTAKNILDHISIEKYGVLKESEMTRMADLHFILLIMSTVDNGGYYAQDKEVENKVQQFNDEYPQKDHVFALLIKTFAIISDLKLPFDSMWFRKSNFFTLVVEIANNIDKLPMNFKYNLISFEEKVMQNKNNSGSEFSRYYSYMYQATHGRTARVTRAEFFQKYCLEICQSQQSAST